MKHDVEKLVLPGGVEGLLINVPNATVMTFDFHLRAGYYRSPRAKWETAHIMEHMLLGANEFHPKARIFQAQLQKNGAMSNAFTNVYSISYVAECADFEWQRVLKLMLMAISKPLFLEDEFKAEVGNVRDELVGYLNNHFRELSLRMQEAFGLVVMTDHERIELIDNVSLDDIKEHYLQTHRSDNIRFVIAGDVAKRRADISKLIQTHLTLERGERFALPDEKPLTMNKAFVVPNKSVQNLHFFLDVFATERIDDDSHDALMLLNTMLTATLHSLILGEARERGVVYSMGSGSTQSKDNTDWWFGAQMMRQNSAELIDIMVTQLKKVLDGKILLKDIESARKYSLGKYQRSAQTVSGVANGYRGRFYFDEVIDDYYAVPERIKSINKQKIVEVAQRMFQEEVWGFGVLGNLPQKEADVLNKRIAELWK